MKSFETVALAELPVLYRVAKRMTLDPDRAEDLVGNVLLKAAKAWPTFDQQYPRSWLLRIMKNEHIMSIRRDKARPETTPLVGNEVDPGSFNEVVNRQLNASVALEALDQLPEDFRIAVALCDVEGLSYEEVANITEVPIGTVRSRLYRGRHMLRNSLRHLEQVLA